MRKIKIAIICGALAAGTSPIGWTAPQPAIPDGAVFVSGGVGDDEEGEMQRMAKDFNLRMQFALQKTGAYLSGVRVSVVDRKGNTLLETVSNGPCLFAKVPKGTYNITADYKGAVQKKAATVGAKTSVNLPLFWSPEAANEPIEKSDDTKKAHRFHGCWKK